VEYGDPIELPHGELPDELVQSVKQGEWAEPPADLVVNLRDLVEGKLAPLTPDRDTFSEVYRDGVIAHVQNRMKENKVLTWREEVLQVRRLKDEPASEEIKEIATRVGDTLQASTLDGTDINSKGDGLRGISPIGALTNLAKFVPMLFLLPTIIIGMGPQILAGRLLGDRTDEGLDARTSYHFLFGMFGSLLWWPTIATIITSLALIFNSELSGELSINLSLLSGTLGEQIIAAAIIWVSLIFTFWLSGVFFAKGWDGISDSKKWLRRLKTNSDVKADLVKLCELLN
tara:strand:+ start:74 stop:934 length:861 start_codon:yes stop_codon:yes gene_type:complete